jgi:PAS domain S-box-containing protein
MPGSDVETGPKDRELFSAESMGRASLTGQAPEQPYVRVDGIRASTRFLKSRIARLGFALILVTVAVVLRAIVSRFCDWFPTYIFMGAVIALASFLGGIWAGILVTALSAIAVIVLPASVRGTYALFDQHGALGLGIATAMGVLISSLIEVLQRRSELLAARLVGEAQKATQAVQAERQRFFAVLESLPAMVAVFSPDHRLVFTNRKHRERFGEAGDRRCYEAFHARTEPCPSCQSFRVLETHVPHRWENSLADGSVLSTDELPFTDVDGSPLVLEVIEDITERRRTENELKEYRERLELLVEERTDQLLQLNRRLQRDIEERVRTENELRVSRATLAAAMNSLGEGVVITDAQGQLVDLNEACAAFCRFPGKDEFVRRFSELDRIFEVFDPDDKPEPQEDWHIARALRGESGTNVERTMRRKDTGETWIGSFTFGPIRDRDGSIIGSVMACHDITERKRTEKLLAATVARFHLILSNLKSGVLLINRDGRIEFVNQSFCDLFELPETPAELAGNVPSEVLGYAREAHANPDQVIPSIHRIIEEGRPVVGEEVLIRGGRTILRDFTPLAIDGKSNGQLWVHTDITERKRAELAVNEALATLHAAAASMTDAIFVTDSAGRLIECNEAYVALQKYRNKAECATSFEEFSTFFELLTTGEEAAPMEMWPVQRALRGEIAANAEYIVRRKDSDDFKICSYSFGPILDKDGVVTGAVVTIRDITDRKKEEKVLANTLERFYLILSNLNTGVLLVNSDARVEFVNQAFCNLLRFQDTPAELVGFSSSDMIDRILRLSQNPEESRIRIQQILERGEGVRGDEFLLRDSISLLSDFVPLTVDGTTFGRLWVFTDVTALKQIGEALRASQQKNELLAGLILASSQPLWVADLGGHLTFVNRAFEEVTGYSREELEIVGWREILTPPEWFDLDRKMIDELKRVGDPVRYEKEYFHKNGARIPIELFLHLAKDSQGQPLHYFAFITDVTSRKQADAELNRLNRMLKALSKSNKALSHATDEMAYLKEVCRLVLEDCGHAMVWIGKALRDEERNVIPIASAGIEDDYLTRLAVKWNEDEQGFIGTAIRTGKSSICRNILADPRLSCWHEKARQSGYVSSIVIPIRVENEIWGAITIYSPLPDAFSDAELALLTELVGDLEFGIQALRTREGRIEAEEKLRASEEILGLFVEHAPAALAMFDTQMRYLHTSRRWREDFGVAGLELHGRSHYEVFPEISEDWKQIHRRALEGELAEAEEDRFERADGSVQWLRWEVRPWHDLKGQIGGILIFSEDITERKRVEDALRESESRFRSVLDNSVDLIYRMNLQTGRYEYISPSVQAVLGRSREEKMAVTKDQSLAMIHPDDMPRVLQVIERIEVTYKEHLEYRELNPDGQYHWMSNNMFLQCDSAGEPLYCDGSIRDITELKQTEIALRESERKLRELAGSLLAAQEEERRSLARELHDDLTQQLAFLSIELGNVAIGPPALSGQVRDRIQALQHQALRASNEMRRISHGLHPSAIEDFGLSIALEEYCEEFMTAQGVFVEFEGLVEDSRLQDRAAACLYRIAQESLRNAAVHGHATRISVTLRVDGDFIQLRVEDNGSGFFSDPNHRKKGLGVTSMTERVRLVNGTLTISSQPGQGTEVFARVPLVGVDHEAGNSSLG